MGDFNPSAPTLLGGEWTAQAAPLVTLDAPNKSVVMRVRPGAQTLTAAHVFLANVVGTPGLAVEVVNALAPNIDLSNVFYPTTDTGDVATGWASDNGGAASFTQIGSANRFGWFNQSAGSRYMKNQAALASGATLPASWRSTGPSLSSKRVLAVWQGITADNSLIGYPNTSDLGVYASVDLVISGTRYTSPLGVLGLYYGFLDFWNTWKWATNPALRSSPTSDQTWTQTAVNALVNGTDSFGMTIHGRLVAGAFLLCAMYLNPVVTAENRMAQYYAFTTPPHIGWNKVTLSSNLGALSGNTWYWVVVSCPTADASNYAQVPVVQSAYQLPDPATASGTGEHRQSASSPVILFGPAATPMPAGSPQPITGQTLTPVTPTLARGLSVPLLLDASGTILSQSQPYARTDGWEVCASPVLISTGAAVTTPGQQVTPSSTTSVAGILVSVGWRNPNLRPDHPLLVSLRHGVGAITGGGTLDGTFTVPTSTPNGFLGLVPIDGGNAINVLSTTQYYLMFTSNATPGQGWVVNFYDTRSDLATAGGSTVAAVEGASIGGQTDAYVVGGAANTRYDVGIALVQGPAAPDSLQAQVLAAAP